MPDDRVHHHIEDCGGQRVSLCNSPRPLKRFSVVSACPRHHGEAAPVVILVCRSCLVHYYLEKGFVILEHNSKQLSSVPNDVKIRIYAINKQKHIMLWSANQQFTM